VEEKNNNLIQSFGNLMLFSGKKIRTLRDKKYKYSNSRVVRKNFYERKKTPFFRNVNDISR
jgi:hypothetical protein